MRWPRLTEGALGQAGGGDAGDAKAGCGPPGEADWTGTVADGRFGGWRVELYDLGPFGQVICYGSSDALPNALPTRRPAERDRACRPRRRRAPFEPGDACGSNGAAEGYARGLAFPGGADERAP